MSVLVYRTAFSIWLNANRSRLIYRLGNDMNLAKMARVEWMKMSEEDKNMWRKKANISAQCLRGRLKKVKRKVKGKGTTKKNPSESIDPSDALSNLPLSILVRHILPRVSPAHYAQLHLVSRRFHRLLCYYADELPKRDFDCLSFTHDWDDEFDFAVFVRAYSGRCVKRCENLDGSRNDKGPSLAVLLRHQRLTRDLGFDQNFDLKNIMNTLIHLAKHKRLCMTEIEFECSMSGVTEGQLKELLSHCSSRLEVFSFIGYGDIGHGVITDTLIASFITNGNLRALLFSRPVGLTDLTLDHFPLIEHFYLCFKHERITPSGVYRFIQRFRNDQKECSGQIIVSTFLKCPLRDLITPDDTRWIKTSDYETDEWIFFKIPSDPSSLELWLKFESC
uniref:F-box domain-containing protein n=1 Tax=Plectus sambesii TaxID=2011161 RepID=A0A914UTI7_9BILA